MYPQGKRPSAAAWVGVLKMLQDHANHAYIPALCPDIYHLSVIHSHLRLIVLTLASDVNVLRTFSV